MLNAAVRSTLAAVALAVGAASAARAQTVVWDNGAPNGIGGRTFSNPYYSASDFTFAAPTTFDGIRFWDVQSGNYTTGGFTISLYSDALGTPGTMFYSAFAAAVQTQQGFGCCGLTRMQNDMSIAPITLAAGTYWMDIHSESSSTMFWETATPSGNSVYADQQSYGPGNWYGVEELSLQLTSVVATPEPASLVLLATGLIGIGGITCRRKKQA